jgi:hypothetical protein
MTDTHRGTFTSAHELLGEAHDADELVAIMRKRKEQLQLSDALVDELSGLGAGHTGKLLGPVPVKRLGAQSLSDLLGALGLKLVVVVDEEQSARIGKRWTRKNTSSDHPALMTIGQARRIVLTRAARKAARVKWAGMSPEQRARHLERLNASNPKHIHARMKK